MYKYRTTLFLLGIAAVLMAGRANTASADITFYDSRAEFEAASEQLTMESFEAPFATGPFVQFTDVRIEEITAIGADAELRRSTAASFATEGFASIEYYSDGPSEIRFQFSEMITAFSIDLIDFGNAGAGILTIQDNGQMSTPHLVATAPPSLAPLTTLFIGYISPGNPFDEVVLTTSSDGDIIAIDALDYGHAIVPEPSTMALALFSIGTLAMVGRRRRRIFA